MAAGRPLFNGPAVALARTLTAMSTLFTMMFTPTAQLFAPAEGRENPIKCDGITGKVNPFCLGDSPTPQIGIAISIIVLSLVIVGILPGITSLLHFYIAFYLQQNIAIPDGGDQITVFLCFMFAIIYLGDLRLSHWSANTREIPLQPYTTITGLYLIKCQMTVVYLNAAIHKMGTEDWLEGSELYYLLGGYFEPSGVLKFIYGVIVDQPFLGVAATWSSMLIELFLGATILMAARWKKVALIVGLVFHLGILAFLGIASFQIAMIAGLIILCLPTASDWLNGATTLTRLNINSIDNEKERIKITNGEFVGE